MKFKADLKWYHNPSPLASANEFVYDLVTIYGDADSPQEAYKKAKVLGEKIYGNGEQIIISVIEQT